NWEVRRHGSPNRTTALEAASRRRKILIKSVPSQSKCRWRILPVLAAMASDQMGCAGTRAIVSLAAAPF
ncbi:MAG: hypothetical protein ACPG07_04515, partial [Henriciella sp.]